MSYPISFPSDKPLARLDYDEKDRIWTLQFLADPDNRLTHEFIGQALLPALDHVEKAWDNIVNNDQAKGGAALITTGQTEKSSKFYSNGLDFERAIADPNFFDDLLNPLYTKLLSFPIPTVASIGGHAFAAGFALGLVHDYRVMNGARGYLCMNEIDFGAQLPAGLLAALQSKISSASLMRKIILEGHRFSSKAAVEAGLVDVAAPGEGAAGTLEAAREMANKVKGKASMDAYGSNKLIIYHNQIQILRTKHEQAMSKL